ncbi:MAG: glycoside hydrolase family 11 protein [Ferruginibacter sp.]|nr:glycoside hydrolase family 11 protein [Ferruginibacter sp.]
MKNIFLTRLALIVVVQSMMVFYANSQAVDTIKAKTGTKICKTALWRVGSRYTAETWFSGGIKGEACLTTNGSKSFIIDWNLIKYGFLHEVGLYDLQVPVDLVNPKASSKHKHSFSNITGAGGYTGLYGWFGKAGATDAIEFYINENWVGDTAINMSSCKKMGTITVDGGTYDIYTRPVKGKAFAQWWSNRVSPHTRGKISYAKHFREWRRLGMPDVVLTRLTYAFECTWGAATGGLLKYSTYKIDQP